MERQVSRLERNSRERHWPTSDAPRYVVLSPRVSQVCWLASLRKPSCRISSNFDMVSSPCVLPPKEGYISPSREGITSPGELWVLELRRYAVTPLRRCSSPRHLSRSG